jgi:hypothetical protein
MTVPGARRPAAELLRPGDIPEHQAHINQIRAPYQRTTKVPRSAHGGRYRVSYRLVPSEFSLTEGSSLGTYGLGEARPPNSVGFVVAAQAGVV